MLQHVGIPETKDAQTLPLQKARAALVVVVPLNMLAAIEFNDQSSLRTDEITNVMADGHVPAKAKATDPATSQPMPEEVLGLCG